MFDKDGTGCVTENEIKIYTKGLISEEEVKEFWKEADYDE